MQNTEHFKQLLEAEMKTVEEQLATVGRKNPAHPQDWQPVEPEVGRDRADETEVADNIEGYDNNQAILEQLEPRLIEIKSALERISNGTYGVCRIGGETIEEDRLEANPAADTCKTHMKM